MIFTPTLLSGVIIVDVEPVSDHRGHFARWYCAGEFAEKGLEALGAQGAISRNTKRGTLRGLHFIEEHCGEAKLVRCVTGAIYDIAVDLRPASPTFKKWIGIELNGIGQRALYIPRGCAHGFLTLTDAADVTYQFSEPHRPGLEGGIRWDDPEIGVAWPFQPEIISERDNQLPYLKDIRLSPRMPRPEA
jgi:dTDP-4-dehydrorhamnose 3,5-epimerase